MAVLDMTRNEMEERAEAMGVHVRTWSPGDGVTRYRFFTDPNNDYFGPDSGLYTALGLKEAITFIRGWGEAKAHEHRREQRT